MTFQKKAILTFKIVVCSLLCLYIMHNVLIDGLSPYYSSKDYDIQTQVDVSSAEMVAGIVSIEQEFLAKGNNLNKISLYYTGNADVQDVFTIKLITDGDSIIAEKKCSFWDYSADSWNKVDMNVQGLTRGNWYTVQFTTDSNQVYLYVSSQTKDTSGIYGGCRAGGVELQGNVFMGFQFTYTYLTSANMIFYVIQSLLTFLFVFVLCYGIFKIEEIYHYCAVYGINRGIIYGFYFAVYMSFSFNPMDRLRTEVVAFTREMGAGLLENYDVSRVISNFKEWFLFFAIILVIYTLTASFHLHFERNKEQKKVLAFLDKFMVLADVNLILRTINFFYDEEQDNIFYYASYVIACVIVLSIIYAALNMDRYISAKGYGQMILGAFSLAFPVAALISTEWEMGKLLLGIQVFFCAGLLVVVRMISPFIRNLEKKKIPDMAAIIFSVFPFLTSFYIEAVNILNQHSVFIAHPRKYYAVVCLLVLIIGIAGLILIVRKKLKLHWWKTWSHVWIITGFACLHQQVALENTYVPDLFESANYSVLINGLLKFGEIPIVEHLGHHMMQSVWEGLIYAFLNGDFAGADVSPYAGYLMVPLTILFYFFVKKIWDADAALWITLLFPFYDHWSYYGWGLLIAFAILLFAKKNTYGRAFWLWCACIWCALNRADLGTAFGIACMLTLVVYIIYEKNWKAVKVLLYPLIVIGVFGVILWCGLCLVKGIHPVVRLIEFMKLFAANINWAYNGIGDNTKTVYAWSYMILPFLMTGTLLYVVFSKKLHKDLDQDRWILLLMLGFSYFSNFSRALTRHSLKETITATAVWTSYIFLSLLVSCLVRKKFLFLPTFVLFILCNMLFEQDGNFNIQPIANVAVSRMGTYTESWTLDRLAEEDYETGNMETYWEEIARKKEVKKRVVYPKSFQDTVAPYGFIFKTLLDEDDTFLDFNYNSFLYSEYDRPDPVYAAQSPTMLSGELTQEYFIDEIKSNMENIPIALMPNTSGNHDSIDGIKLNYKYYKVAEFIYTYYRPLCEYENFAVWCLKDKYDEMAELLRHTEVFERISKMSYLLNDDFYVAENCDVEKDIRGRTLTMVATAADPMLLSLESSLGLSSYAGEKVNIVVEYTTADVGTMQLFYTTEEGEVYTAEKCVNNEITGEGTACFTIPVTQNTKVRLDIPEDSTVVIRDISISSVWKLADWGYDQALHHHVLNHLPRIWAEFDKRDAAGNMVVAEDIKTGIGFHTFRELEEIERKDGNYLMLTAVYTGIDINGFSRSDDEYTTAVLIAGIYDGDMFTEKCRYEFTLKEGKHDYLFRISSDYYWNLGEINMVEIECQEQITEVDIKILQGD